MTVDTKHRIQSLQNLACASLQLAAATFADIGGYYFDLSQDHDD
jgi:hypothetical protein